MADKSYLLKVEEYYEVGKKWLAYGDISNAYSYQIFINQELRRLHEEKVINLFAYKHYKKHYTIDKRKK